MKVTEGESNTCIFSKVDNSEGRVLVVCGKIWDLNLYSFWSKWDQTKKCYFRPTPTTLFNININELAELFGQSSAPGLTLNNTIVIFLLCADDLVLLSPTVHVYHMLSYVSAISMFAFHANEAT